MNEMGWKAAGRLGGGGVTCDSGVGAECLIAERRHKAAPVRGEG